MSPVCRAAFVRANSRSGDGEAESVSQFSTFSAAWTSSGAAAWWHRGSGEYTIYTACCSLSQGIYYYTTYDNHAITAIDLHKTDLNGDTVATYPLVTGEQIYQETGKIFLPGIFRFFSGKCRIFFGGKSCKNLEKSGRYNH